MSSEMRLVNTEVKITREQRRSIPNKHLILMTKAHELGGEDSGVELDDMLIGYLKCTPVEREKLMRSTQFLVEDYS